MMGVIIYLQPLKEVLYFHVANMVVVAQLVRAPVCGTGGRGFEPHLLPIVKRFSLFSENLFFMPENTDFNWLSNKQVYPACER
jgi:hypothetical protein